MLDKLLGDALLQVVKDGDIGRLESLLRQTENINDLLYYQKSCHHNGYSGTLLYHAAKWEKEGIVELLLKRGANPNIKGWGGRLPLLEASGNGNQKIIELLLEYGANVNVEGIQHITSLHAAVSKGHKKVVEILLKAGANVNHYSEMMNYDGTPLHLAINMQEMELVELLLDNGADINAADESLRAHLIYRSSRTSFLFSILGVNLSRDDLLRIASPRRPYDNILKSFTESEQIKKMPHLGKLIEAFKNRDKTLILNYIDQGNAKNKKELMLEIQEIKERYSSDQELSFIPKCLYDFMEPKIKQAYKIKECKTEAVSSLMNIGYENIKLSPKLSIISKLLWIKQCFYKIMPFLTKNIDDAPPKKQCHNNNFHDVAENIAQYLNTKDLQNLALVCKDINISVNNEKECSEKRINESVGKLTTDVKQVLNGVSVVDVQQAITSCQV